MADRSSIEWCDSTFNPWIGCTKVSPACDHCYAERDFDLRRHVVQWGAGQARKRTGDDNWKNPGKWNAKSFFQCEDCGHRSDGEKWREVGPNMGLTDSGYACPRCNSRSMNEARRRVFCASLADVFDNEVPVQWRISLMKLIIDTPNLDWQLLTKRIGNAAGMLETAFRAVRHGREGWADNVLPNVWLGATVCTQDEADRDIPKLLSTPAAVRFLSVEPMLGPIDLKLMQYEDSNERDGNGRIIANTRRRGLHWVICGGESGPRARPMHPHWARDLRDQCAAAGVPFLFKQWGEFADHVAAGLELNDCYERSSTGGWVEPDGALSAGDEAAPMDIKAAHVFRVGKKTAGRLLDGRTHDGFPGERS